MEQKKISIIVPVYNTSEELLRICINSIIHQTYTNIEIIIIDDGSDCEETVRTYNSFAEIDFRVKVIVQDNMGESKARYKGIQNASGDFIVFCDSDDRLHVEACARLLDLMQGGKYDLVEAMAIEVNSVENINDVEYDRGAKKITIHSNQLLMEELVKSCALPLGWSVWAKMFKGDLLKKYYEPHGGIYRGADVVTLAEYVKQIQHYIGTDQIVYFYNKGNQDSVTKSKSIAKNITICRYGKCVVEIYKDSGCKKGFLYAKANYCGMLYGSLLQCMYYKIENHKKIEAQIKNEMWKYAGELLWNPYIQSRFKNIIALVYPKFFVLIRKLKHRKLS